MGCCIKLYLEVRRDPGKLERFYFNNIKIFEKRFE